jgi:hypothetical protein
MARFALAVAAVALIATSAMAQNSNQSGPPLPQNPGGATSSSADENGIGGAATPGAGPNGAVMDSTRSGDDGAYARQNSNRTSGQGASPAPAAPATPDQRGSGR